MKQQINWRNPRIQANAWRAIEARLRALGAPDTAFHADMPERATAAKERFYNKQFERVEQGLEAMQLPDDPRELVQGAHPWWAVRLTGALSAVRDYSGDRVRKHRAAKKAAKELEEKGDEEGNNDECL